MAFTGQATRVTSGSGLGTWWTVDGRPVWVSDSKKATGATGLPGNSVLVRGRMLSTGIVWADSMVPAAASASANGAPSASGIPPWNSPALVLAADNLSDAASPSLAYTPDGTEHVVSESGGEIYYAYRRPGSGWVTTDMIARGYTPVLKADQSGNLHLLFANEVLGNYEIYHMRYEDSRWSVPTAVSRTDGYSAMPALAVGNGRRLYAAWADSTPGFPTTYIGTWNGSFWSSEPVPGGRGESPAITATANGAVFVAWQDQLYAGTENEGYFEIFASELQGRTWSVARNISASSEEDSIGASIAVSGDGRVHLTWVDGEVVGDRVIRYCSGVGAVWEIPQAVATSSNAPNAPQIVVESGNLLHIVWAENAWLRAANSKVRTDGPPDWPTKPEIVTSLSVSAFRHVAVAVRPQGGTVIVWVQPSTSGKMAVYESLQASYGARAWLPGILNR